MAFCTILSAALQGLCVKLVQVEADVSNGLPVFHMVGYLSSEVKEASERVRTAVRNCGFQLPPKRILVNLAPATVRKRGAAFDLPIALSVLGAMGMFPEERLKGTLVIGELSLDGRTKRVPGILPIVMEAQAAGCHTCILPAVNAAEGALVEGIRILGVESLEEACRCLKGEGCARQFGAADGKPRAAAEGVEKGKPGWKKENGAPDYGVDYRDIQGQETVKRAAEVAVAGGHNLLLIGPPGSGKSMIAKRLPTILPPPDLEERMEMTKIYSVLGLVNPERPLMDRRPFRSVHHTVTRAALIGGGGNPSPGEISLAHAGVLFLDELAEFPRSVLEVLRQPLEERKICLSRSHGVYTFPANFILVAAMNPCPCGNYPDMERCTCTPAQIQQYLGKISQPLLDRIDICTEASRISYEELREQKAPESSEEIRARVLAARRIQEQRCGGQKGKTNAMLEPEELRQVCALGGEEERLMRQAFDRLGLTARTYHKILKVARTIADLEGEERIRLPHLSEAVGYRTLDKKYWGR